jgi:hypothetical protein
VSVVYTPVGKPPVVTFGTGSPSTPWRAGTPAAGWPVGQTSTAWAAGPPESTPYVTDAPLDSWAAGPPRTGGGA